MHKYIRTIFLLDEAIAFAAIITPSCKKFFNVSYCRVPL
jgi:hypothetical protein